MSNTKTVLCIGTDKLEISKTEIIGINQSEIENDKNSIIENSNEGISVMNFENGEEITLNDLSIIVPTGGGYEEDKSAVRLNINKQRGLKGEYYTTLSVNAPRLFEETNEKNVCTIKDLAQLPKIIEEKLSERGVLVNLEESNIKYFEINANTEDPMFKETLELINEGWKSIGEKVYFVDGEDGIESMKCKRATRTLKIYDKAKELKETGQKCSCENLIRVEVSISHTTTIKQLLKNDTSFVNFCNSLDVIQDYYRKIIIDDIQKPAKKLMNKLEKDIYKELESGKKPQQIYTSYINDKVKRKLIVDLAVFDNAMAKYYKKNKKKNLSRDIKSLHNKIIKATSLENYQRLTNNMERIERFIEMI